MTDLIPHIVLYTNSDFNVPEASMFMAENSEHAEEQMLLEDPDASVVWVVQTEDVNEAFDIYHKESTAEDV